MNNDWRKAKLYVITAGDCHPGREMLEVMEQTLLGGAGMLQLRNKTGNREEVLREAKALRQLTRKYGVPLIINDYPEIALEADADGVHIGQEDMPVAEARGLLGHGKLIGVSTHSLEQGMAAEAAGADYIGVGPVYPTATKPGKPAVTTAYVADAASHIGIPFVAIGGIHAGNAGQVAAAGARMVCAVSAIVGSADPAAVCRTIIAAVEENAPRLEAKPIMLNGLARRTTASNLEQLIRQFGQEGKRLVAEVDGVVVQRSLWADTPIGRNARVELVAFVGGG